MFGISRNPSFFYLGSFYRLFIKGQNNFQTNFNFMQVRFTLKHAIGSVAP